MIIFWLLLLIFLNRKYTVTSKNEFLDTLSRSEAFQFTQQSVLARVILREALWSSGAALSGY